MFQPGRSVTAYCRVNRPHYRVRISAIRAVAFYVETRINKLIFFFIYHRDRRFERDMQMTQSFCVLLSQLLFLAEADATDNQVNNIIAYNTVLVNSIKWFSLLSIQGISMKLMQATIIDYRNILN